MYFVWVAVGIRLWQASYYYIRFLKIADVHG